MTSNSNVTPVAPLWHEVVADGHSHHYETQEEAQSELEIFKSRGLEVDENIYQDSCLPIGEYFVGDPSLVLKDWSEGKGTKYPLENGVYLLEDKTYFAIYKAANGPGSYPDEKGNIYSTQSGYFAFLPRSLQIMFMFMLNVLIIVTIYYVYVERTYYCYYLLCVC